MKKFIVLWLGEFISTIGSGMTSFAIGIYMYQVTKSVTWVSIAALLAYLPTILLNPVGGVLADRYDRRLMMIIGDLFSALGLLYILVSIHLGNNGVIPICIGITISSVFISLLEPAYKATVTDMLTEDEYAKASGMVQIAGAARYLISPAIAGIILSFSDIRLILIIDILTIFITVFSASYVRKTITEVKCNKDNLNFFKEFKEGFKAITNDKGIVDMIILMAFMCFFIAFIQTLMTPMILAFADSKTLGIMESISAVGMMIGSIAIGMMNIKKGYVKILIISLMLSGLFMGMVGLTTNLMFILITCILFFTTLPFVNTCADVLIRINMPNEVQGRAWGIISVLTQIGYIIAYCICGILADKIFNPMLMKDGILANSLGRIIGTGEGRGIGLMLIIAGAIMMILAVMLGSKKNIKQMERKNYELVNNQK